MALIAKPLAPFLVPHPRGWAPPWTCLETSGHRASQELVWWPLFWQSWKLASLVVFRERQSFPSTSLLLEASIVEEETCKPFLWGLLALALGSPPSMVTLLFHFPHPQPCWTLVVTYWSGPYPNPVFSCLLPRHGNWEQKQSRPGIFHKPPKRNLDNRMSPPHFTLPTGLRGNVNCCKRWLSLKYYK